MFTSPGDRAGRGRRPPVQIGDAATITLSAAKPKCYLYFDAAVGINARAMANPAASTQGAQIVLWTKQDSIGNRTLTYGSKFAGPNGLLPQPTGVALAVDRFTFTYSAISDVWLVEKTPLQLTSTWSLYDKGTQITVSSDQLTAVCTGAVNSVRGTRSVTAAVGLKKYFEVTMLVDNQHLVGLGLASAATNTFPGGDANGWGYYGVNGQKNNAGAGAAYGATYTLGDVIGVYLNGDGLEFLKNGANQGVAYTGMTGRVLFPDWGSGSVGASRAATINTGGTPLLYLPAGATAWS